MAADLTYKEVLTGVTHQAAQLRDASGLDVDEDRNQHFAQEIRRAIMVGMLLRIRIAFADRKSVV